MTFQEFMQENGYDLITTFWEDFSIADKYGIAGVKDTYKDCHCRLIILRYGVG